MAGQRLSGAAAQTEAMRTLAHSCAGIESSLAPFEPRSTFEVWFSTFRGIEDADQPPGSASPFSITRIVKNMRRPVVTSQAALPEILRSIPNSR